MRRREFITLLGGAAIAWLLAATKADSGTLSLGGLSRIGAAAELFSIPVSEIKGAINAR